MKCIADLERTPLRKKIVLSAIPVGKFAGGALNYWNADTRRNLLDDSVTFYLLNELVGEVAKTSRYKQCPDLLEYYLKFSLGLALDMARYLQVTTTREARYQKDETFFHKFSDDLKDYAAMFTAIIGTKAREALEIIIEKTKDDDEWLMGDYTKTMVLWYNDGTYSSAYGGKAWGGIADVLHKFISGDIPAETFVDQCWSLQHNTSSVFNKGLIFETGWLSQLKHVLDMQAEGQLGAWFCTADTMSDYTKGIMSSRVGTALLAGMIKLKEHSPELVELAEKYKPELLKGINLDALPGVYKAKDTAKADVLPHGHAQVVPMVQIHPKLSLQKIERN